MLLTSQNFKLRPTTNHQFWTFMLAPRKISTWIIKTRASVRKDSCTATSPKRVVNHIGANKTSITAYKSIAQQSLRGSNRWHAFQREDLLLRNP